MTSSPNSEPTPEVETRPASASVPIDDAGGDPGATPAEPAESAASQPTTPVPTESAASTTGAPEPAASGAADPVEPTTPVATGSAATGSTASAATGSTEPAPSSWQSPATYDSASLGSGPDRVGDDSATSDETIASDPSGTDSSAGTGPSDRYPTLIPLMGALVGLTAVAALLLSALALPFVKSEPHDVPVGVGGTKQVTDQLVQLFTQQGKDRYDVRVYPSESALREAIEDREVYGGIAVEAQTGASMLVSSAASTTAADELNAFASALSQQVQAQIPARDVASLPSADRRGAGLVTGSPAFVLASVLPALLLVRLYRRRPGTQVAAAAGASALIGLVLSAVLNQVLGTTEGSNLLLVAVGLAAGVFATSLVLLGLNAIAGRIGLWIGAAVLVFLAEPISGLRIAPEWLPGPLGTIGQFLPPGANGELLRSLAFFDGNGVTNPLLALGAWAVVGAILIGAGVLVEGTRTGADEPADPDDTPDAGSDDVEIDLDADTTTTAKV